MGPPREADVKLAALVPQHNKSTNVNPSRPHIIIAGILLNRIFGVPTLAQMKGTADSCRGVVDEECGRAAADAYLSAPINKLNIDAQFSYHFPERAQSSSIRLAGSSFKPPCCARAGRRASHQPLPVCHRRRIKPSSTSSSGLLLRLGPTRRPPALAVGHQQLLALDYCF